jgi:hypothetical protein
MVLVVNISYIQIKHKSSDKSRDIFAKQGEYRVTHLGGTKKYFILGVLNYRHFCSLVVCYSRDNIQTFAKT